MIFSYEFENKGVLYHLKAALVDIPKPEFTLNFHTEVLMADRLRLLNLDFAPSDRQIAKFIVENNFL